MATFNGGADRDAYYGTVDADQINGNGGNDYLMGGGGDDEIDGGDDNDDLFGGAGDDLIRGGAGADTIYAAEGNDTVYGGDGSDRIQGGYSSSDVGNDTIDGGEGDDFVDGFGGDDFLLGGNGSDSLKGGYGRDYLDGGDGDDFLSGYGDYTPTAEMDPDTLIGGSGDDRLFVGYGDSADGGIGTDALYVEFYKATSGGVDVDFRQLANNGTLVVGGGVLTNIEYVWGISLTDFDDKVIAGAIGFGVYGITIDGWGGNDVLTGTAASDSIFGGDGDDVIYGLGGRTPGVFPPGDRLRGEAGNDTIYAGDDDTEASGGTGDDSLHGGRGNDSLIGESGNDTLIGGDGDDGLQGGDGLDLLVSGTGADYLTGGDGDDRLYFGAGFGAGDKAVGDAGTDALILQGVYSVVLDDWNVSSVETIRLLSAADATFGGGGAGPFTYDVTISDYLIPYSLLLTVDAAGLAAGETLRFDASAEKSARFAVISGAADDVLIGGGGNDSLSGGDGNDALTGNRGFDSLAGGEGDDVLDGGSFDDTLEGGNGNDTLYGGGDVDTLDGGAGDDVLYGDYSPTGSANALTPLSNDDVLRGGTGNDLLVAGSGADQLKGEEGDDRLYFGAWFDRNTDTADGGAGSDQLILQGIYGNLSITGAGVAGFETIRLLSATDSSFGPAPGGSFRYRITLLDDYLAAGALLTVDAAGLTAGETAYVNGAPEVNGRFDITGGAGNDEFYGGGGDDVLRGGAGDDLLYAGDGNDQLIGGAGNDNLRGGAGVDSFDGGTGGEAAGGDKVSFFDPKATQGAVADLRTGSIANDGFGNAETMTNIESLGNGTAFADVFLGNDFANILAGETSDTLEGYGGDDIVRLRGAPGRADGGSGTDQLELSSIGGFYLPDSNGDGSAELAPAMTIGWTVNLANGSVEDGYGNVGVIAGFERVIGSALADRFTGDGADNYLDGAGGNDLFDMSGGGDDTVLGGDGNDYVYFGAAFTAADTIVGGAGTDTVGLLGNYNLTLGANTLSGVETFSLLSGTAAGGTEHVTYSITTVDANVPAGGRLTVYAGGLLADESLFFNGYAETDGALSVYGGAGNDTFAGGPANDAFVGGAGDDLMYGLGGMDWLEGGLGADGMRGGPGNDLFVYQSAAESTAAKTDHIFDFEYVSDHISLTNVDANANVAGDQAFTFIGSNAFSNTAGELRAYQSGSSWFVEGDVNGDGTADLVIQVDPVGGHAMIASDFFL